MAISKSLFLYFCLISILTRISNTSDAAVVPTDAAVARNQIRGPKLPASKTMSKTQVRNGSRVDPNRDCGEMGSRSECIQNPKCRWCRSDSLDDMCFSKSEAWRLPSQQGCKPVEHMDIMGSSAVSHCSSYQPSPGASFNPSPISSSFASPVSSHYTNNANNNNADPNSLIPWLKNLSSGTLPPSSKHPHHLYIPGGSVSAPVTPPLSSPTARTPRMNGNWDDATSNPAWQHFPFLPSSTPQSPGLQTPPESGWLSGVQTPQDGPSSPTFSLVAANTYGFKEPLLNGGSRMWTPGQSGTCSPAMMAGLDQTADVPMCDAISAEFAFGSSNNKGLVKPWEGERIHDECVPDDLELTLGNSSTR